MDEDMTSHDEVGSVTLVASNLCTKFTNPQQAD